VGAEIIVQHYRHFTLPLYFRAVRSGDLVSGRFRIESLAGSGGMGSVWRAYDQEGRRTVALKLLHGRDPRDAARFIREAQLIAGLAHHGIVGFVADGQLDGGERYLVMEWLEGESLEQRLEREPLTLAETLVFGQRAAEALGAMHERGVVHRDLKPSNLFLEERDPERVKLIDFGIARRAVGPDVTRTGVLLGTPGYIAPEQALGDRLVDARADVFALGCVLFKCLTGEGAYGGEDDLTVLLRVVKGTARRARDVVPRIPEELDTFVAWMLERLPADRPQEAGVVAAGLARLGAIYGAGRPGDDPLDELVTTRNRAIDIPSDEPSLGSTSPFPLTTPRGSDAVVTAAIADELPTDDGVELVTDPSLMSEASSSFAADVARALREAEARSTQAVAAPSPPAYRSPTAQPPPAQLMVRPPTPAPKPVPPALSKPSTPPPPPAPKPAPPAVSSNVRATFMGLGPPAAAAIEDAADPRVVQALRSAEGYLKQNDFRNALLQTRRGLDAGAQGDLLGALHTRQAEAHRWRGELVSAERAAAEAMAALAPGSEMWWLAAREAVLAAGSRNDTATVNALAEQMTRLLPTARADASSVGTLTCTATYLMHTGQIPLLEKLIRWVDPLVRKAETEPPAVAARLLQMRALAAMHEGDLGAYLLASEAAAERFAAASDMRNALTQRVNSGFAKQELGAYAHAEADLRAAIGGAERMGLNHVVLAARANLGIVLSKRESHAEARTIMMEVLKESVAEGDRRFEASARTHLSLILLAAGDEVGAVREAKGAVEMTPPHAPPRVFALGALARAQLANDRAIAALEAAEHAMDLLDSMGGIEEGESLVRLVVAEAKHAVGDVEGAASAIGAARDRLHARAASIGDPAFRQSFLRDVAENARTLSLAREWRGESGGWQT
jgi:serine/threonine protein kinase/tetratricopeptide (TPR) repeat protein